MGGREHSVCLLAKVKLVPARSGRRHSLRVNNRNGGSSWGTGHKPMSNETGNQLLEERPSAVSELNSSEFDNLRRLADQIEELSRQPCYLEWTSTGVVSRYVDGLQARVDLEQPNFVNRRAYLSVEQLEKLAAMPEAKIQLDYGTNLTERHFNIIVAYRETYYPQEPAGQDQSRTTTTPVGARSAEKRQLDFSTTKSKAIVAVGALALAAVIGTTAKFDGGSNPTIASATVNLHPTNNLGVLRDTELVARVEASQTSQMLDSPIANFEATSPDGAEPLASATAFPKTLANVRPQGQNNFEQLVADDTSSAQVMEAELALPEDRAILLLSAPTEDFEEFAVVPEDDAQSIVEAIVVSLADYQPESTGASQIQVTVNHDIVERQLNPAELQTSNQSPQSTVTEPTVEAAAEVQYIPPATTTPKAPAPESKQHQLAEEHMDWLRQAGISESDWYYVWYIVHRESSWRPFIWNKQGSSAFGLCQRMMSLHKLEEGDDYMTDPVAQLEWCDEYAHERYGSWQSAYNTWRRKHWWRKKGKYDKHSRERLRKRLRAIMYNGSCPASRQA